MRPGTWASRSAVEVRATVFVVFVVLYVAGAAWGLSLANEGGISAWYPPAALALALTTLLGPRWAPAIFVADVAQWALVGEQRTPGAEILYALIQAVVFGLAGAVLRRTMRGDPPLARAIDLVAFLAVGAVAAPLLAGVLIMAIYVPVSDIPWSEYPEQVRTLFVGDTIAITTLTPALLTMGAWVRGVPLAPASPRGAATTEDLVLGVALVVIPVAAIVSFSTQILFVGVFPLIWVALRRGFPAATFAIAVWALASVITFDLVELDVPLVDAQTFILDGGTLALICGAVVSERERGRSRFAFLALHDDITGLPNQHRLMTALTEALGRERQRRVAVLVVQFRGLRGILTATGRAHLDELLTVAAERLRTLTGPEATLARLSPSRFVVLLEGPTAHADAAPLADRAVAALSAPMQVDGRELALDVSVGLAFGTPENTPDTVLARADAATARAARQPGSHAVAYDAELAAEVQRRQSIERALAAAIDAEALSLAFQPIVSVEDGGPIDAEALLRWTNADGETVPPMEFVPIAEETGLILRLGRWVLHEACRRAAAWPRVGGREVCVTVNVSPSQLQDAGFVDDVRDALREAGLAPQRLRLEVTETVLVEDLETAIARLTELRRLGVEAMLDDFGTGYSSLSWIQRLPVSALKVDRSFVAGIADAEVDRAIVRATIGLARALGIGVVAEGVETPEQREILVDLGCPRIQGYLVCRPVPDEEFVGWLGASDSAQPA